MTLYLLLYFFIAFLLLGVGFLVFKKYIKTSWIYFMISVFFIWLRFLLYIFSFLSDLDINLIDIIFRLMFFFSLAGVYYMLFFFLFFNTKFKKSKYWFYIILSIFWIIFYYIIFTNFIIKWVEFDLVKNKYYEIYWIFYNYYFVLFYIFLIWFLGLGSYVIRKQVYINKIRLKYIFIWFIIFIYWSQIFQLLLPLYWINIFEKEIILFSIPFILWIYLSISKYNFIDFKFRYKEIVSFLLSIFLTIILFLYLKYMSVSLWEKFINFWWISNTFTYFDLIFWIIFYNIFYKLFTLIIPWNTEYNRLNKIINKWKEMIPFITNLYDLNSFLLKEIKSKFNISYVNIKLINEGDKEIFKYFRNNLSSDIFINDIVFIEENKHQFNKNKIFKEIKKEINIIFPMSNNKWDLIGVFELWNKSFNEQYYSEEINIIKDFVKFLSGHLKYIEIYSKINDLNINLDKKVDEKTIEFNKLISKQREFISMSSHEIKTPVMSASLQIENFLDDIESWDYDQKYLLEETKVLKEQIFKISDLVKNIFSVQKYEIKDIWFYIEKVKLDDIIIWEYDILHRIYENIDFDIDISDDIWFIDIDKIQFTQVISNLLNNAIKFVNNKNPKIKITARLNSNNIILTIEDNWKWFSNWEEKNIFKKYSTLKWKSVWIWMWLYLCKKIVELHWWNIKAENSIKLWWAKFKISIPKKKNK